MGKLTGRKREIAMLKRIKLRLGIYAVPGNHDYYDDIDEAVFFMESAGMKVLRSEAAEAGGILIVGADDKDHLIREQWNLSRSETLVLSYEREQREKFLLLLTPSDSRKGHGVPARPSALRTYTRRADLPSDLFQAQDTGISQRTQKNSKCGGFIYVSNGAGFVGPPIRLLAPPENSCHRPGESG